MARPKICVSFDYENDKYSRNALRSWNENRYIDFDIIDKTPNEIDTYNISRIKAGLTTKISEANILLVISGDYINMPHRDRREIGCINWQNWECKKAIELNKRIILVKLKSNNLIPEELLGQTREDVVGLELDKINRAISNIMVHQIN